jgi:hypothetical protein
VRASEEDPRKRPWRAQDKAEGLSARCSKHPAGSSPSLLANPVQVETTPQMVARTRTKACYDRPPPHALSVRTFARRSLGPQRVESTAGGGGCCATVGAHVLQHTVEQCIEVILLSHGPCTTPQGTNCPSSMAARALLGVSGVRLWLADNHVRRSPHIAGP